MLLRSSWKVLVSESSFRGLSVSTFVEVVSSDVADVVDVAAVDNVVTVTVGVVFPIIFEYRSLSIASIPIFGFGVTDVVSAIVVIISDLVIVTDVVEIVDDEAESIIVLVEVLVMEVVDLVVVAVKVVLVVD